MSTQIQFKSGEFQQFVATRSFALGSSGVKIEKDSRLEFDGTHVKYEGSAPVLMPQLRGAVKTDWIVPVNQYDPNDVTASMPRSAGIQIRSAQGGNPMEQPRRSAVATVNAEEREVGNVKAHADRTRETNTRARPGRRIANTPSGEGVEVRTLSTPTKHNTNFEHESPGEALRKVNNLKIEAGAGMTREEYVETLPEEERAAYLANIEARRQAHVASEDPAWEREREANRRILAGKLAPVQNQQKEGFNINNEVGGGVETFDLGGTGGPAEESVSSMEGMTFRNTNAGRPKVAPSNGSVDPRRKIAKSICADFPDNYGFDDPVRKKIARLQADFDDRPDVIRAVAAADTDLEVRQRLIEEFPDAFS